MKPRIQHITRIGFVLDFLIMMIRKRMKYMNLIRQQDKCKAMRTIGQTETECGVRMAAYMILFRSLDIKQTKTEDIINIILGYVASERKHKATLSAKRRKDRSRLLKCEQKLTMK